MTKNVLTKAALTLALALTASAPSAFAKGAKKPKPSAEHVAAVKKCNDDYKTARNSSRTLKGRERTAAYAKAKADRKQCLADAPK
jgi:phosphate-selective porin